MREKIKKAVDVAQRAQRNYDLSKTIPEEDLETLIYTARNSPSKQNETHYSLHVYTDKDKIREIYNVTKKFIFGEHDDILDPNKGENWMYENKSVHNSQILSNALFVYVEDDGDKRGVTHFLSDYNNEENFAIYDEQRSYSMGISVGQLILTATLLGYKTGICSAFEPYIIRDIIKVKNRVRLLVGVGYENIGVDRQLHAETLNTDIPEKFRTGSIDEKWRFPSFEKNTKVLLNGK